MEDTPKKDFNSSLSPSMSTNTNRSHLQALIFTPNIRIVRDMVCPKGSTTVAYTDDLGYLAAGQEDGSIVLFPEGEGDPRIMCDYETALVDEPCTDLKIKSSPNRSYHKTLLAGYLSGHIKLWDTTIGKVLFTLKENRQLFSLCYHPRSHKFASVGNDFKVNIYDEETRVTERVLASTGAKGCKKGHNDCVCAVKFHPKNPFEVISGGVDNTIHFWDVRAPYSVRAIEGVTVYGEGIDISEDGNVILSCLSNSWQSPVNVYDYSTGKLLRSHTKPGCFPYTCKFITPVLVGLGGFFSHTFRVINMRTSQVCGSISGLPKCVMAIAFRKKVPRFKTDPNEMSKIAISSGNRVLELEIIHHEDIYKNYDFYYEIASDKSSNE